MVHVQLNGVHSVRVRLRSGVKTYHYAWRGGPRLSGVPGSPEFVASYTAAHASRKATAAGDLHKIITAFKASPEYKRLGAHTLRAYAKHLDEIQTRFGSMSRAVLDDQKCRPIFLDWRDEMAETPRKADYAIGTLKRLLSWAVMRCLVTTNQAAPIERLHRSDKSEDIWTEKDLKAFHGHASAELGHAVDLARLTGLRQSDLIKLAWNHEDGQSFRFKTSKRQRTVIIPITTECRDLLNRIPRRGPVILTTAKTKRPWTADGLRSSFAQACKDAGVSRTFHDLRRTAATALVSAGLNSSEVAQIMGWSEDDVEAMKRKYVSRSAVVESVLDKLERGR